MPRDVHRALEHLEEFHAELTRPSDIELKYAIEKVIGIFKTNLFHALCDIQDFYDNTLMNERISFLQKSIASREFADRWASNPPFSGAYVRSHFPAAAISSYPREFVEVPRPYSAFSNRLIDDSGREWEVEEILLDIRPVGLGFSITGGTDREPNPDHLIRVTEILKDGAVAKDGRVKVGDVILKINDADCVNVPHQRAVDAIHAADGYIRLLVKRLKPNRSLSQSYLADNHLRREENVISYSTPAPSRSRSLHQIPTVHAPVSSLGNQSYHSFTQPTPPGRIVDPNAVLGLYDPRVVTLRKGAEGLGFNIVGGEDGEPIYVSHVLPGGVADLSGNVRKGDILLQVNDMNLRSANHQQAAIALRGAHPGFVHLTLQYRPREFRNFEEKVERLRQDMLAGRVSVQR
ncbi:hypothetical protein FO519_002800 [Halicephalobus sp. NKZ332]|nr:hypothetical protein FO519_002800 [Halicephalobus sp. NKZ332]